jgi:hypothetical protein
LHSSLSRLPHKSSLLGTSFKLCSGVTDENLVYAAFFLLARAWATLAACDRASASAVPPWPEVLVVVNSLTGKKQTTTGPISMWKLHTLQVYASLLVTEIRYSDLGDSPDRRGHIKRLTTQPMVLWSCLSRFECRLLNESITGPVYNTICTDFTSSNYAKGGTTSKYLQDHDPAALPSWETQRFRCHVCRARLTKNATLAAQPCHISDYFAEQIDALEQSKSPERER